MTHANGKNVGPAIAAGIVGAAVGTAAAVALSDKDRRERLVKGAKNIAKQAVSNLQAVNITDELPKKKIAKTVKKRVVH